MRSEWLDHKLSVTDEKGNEIPEMQGNAFAFCKFPLGPHQVPDDAERPQLVVLDYQNVAVGPEPDQVPPEIEDIFEHKGTDG